MGEKKSKQRSKKKKQLNFVVRMMRQYALSKSSIISKLDIDSIPNSTLLPHALPTSKVTSKHRVTTLVQFAIGRDFRIGRGGTDPFVHSNAIELQAPAIKTFFIARPCIA